MQELLSSRVREYWDTHIHDIGVTSELVGSSGFFRELDQYRFEKLGYLLPTLTESNNKEKRLLEVGCGLGIDLLRFARAGANVTGIDLSETSIDLARKNFAHNELQAELITMDGGDLAFDDDSFDIAYCHGVLQYAAAPESIVQELFRVLKPGGTAILMVYNRYSWLPLISKITGVGLEHDDAPVFRTYSIAQFTKLLEHFSDLQIVPERFPVKTRLHHGLKAGLYNKVFVNAFHFLPDGVVRKYGWHLMAFARKQ